MVSPPIAWQIRYEPGVPSQLPPPDEPFHSIASAAAAIAPGSPAIVYFERRFSYAELEAESERAALALMKAGVGAGGRVLLALPNCPMLVAAALGTLRAGAAIVPLATAATDSQLEAAIRSTKPDIAIVMPALARRIAALGLEDAPHIVLRRPGRDLPFGLRLLGKLKGIGGRARPAGAQTWEAFLNSGKVRGKRPDLPEVGVDQAAWIEPALDESEHARAFAHRHLVAGAMQMRAWMTDAQLGDEAWLLLAPLSDPFGFVVGLGSAMLLRARLILTPGLDFEDIRDAARYLRPGYIFSTSAAVALLSELPELAHIDFRSVRTWISGGEVASDRAAAFEAATGLELCQGYAPEGVAGLATCNPINGRRQRGSIGLPLPGIDVRLVDGPLRSAGVGALELSGPNVAAEGWMPAGLHARVDDGGYLHLSRSRP